MQLPVVGWDNAPKASNYYRPELDGLRAVAVLLVACYHIWLGTISGGVDVFLLLTGFFITASLMRMVQRYGSISLGSYFGRLASRLIPTAATVLLASLLLTMLFLPSTRWRAAVEEVIASALYYQNWKLAFTSTDYLAQDQPASIVQHFWSISIQGQFYILWALLFMLLVFLCGRSIKRFRIAMLVSFGLVFGVSFAYSVVSTANNNVWAYFDTGTRMWEFALGASLALFITSIKLPKELRFVFGWVGLLALVSCGMLVPNSEMFPGYIALWPTGAALLIIVAGSTNYKLGVDRFLTWQPIKYLGGLAYGIFLWHWPLFITFREISGQATAGLFDGLGIIALSIILAYITKKVLEDGLGSILPKRGKAQVTAGLTVGVSFLIPVLVMSLTWTMIIGSQNPPSVSINNASSDELGDYPGAQVFQFPELAGDVPNLPMTPDPAEAVDDVPEIYNQGCHADIPDTEALKCYFGELDDPEATLAVVGASRTAHWLPAIVELAEENSWQVVSITKSACLLSLGDEPTYRDSPYNQCVEWRDNAIDELVESDPDLVITSSTRTGRESEWVPGGYIKVWEELEEAGLSIMGIRDSPVVAGDVVDCAASTSPEDCLYDVGFYPDSDPAMDSDEVPDNVTPIDLTGYVCPDLECPAVIGNVLIYRDSRHITASYSKTLAPIMEERILETLDSD